VGLTASRKSDNGRLNDSNQFLILFSNTKAFTILYSIYTEKGKKGGGKEKNTLFYLL